MKYYKVIVYIKRCEFYFDTDDVRNVEIFKTKEEAIKFIYEHSNFNAVFNRIFGYMLIEISSIDISLQKLK